MTSRPFNSANFALASALNFSNCLLIFLILSFSAFASAMRESVSTNREMTSALNAANATSSAPGLALRVPASASSASARFCDSARRACDSARRAIVCGSCRISRDKSRARAASMSAGSESSAANSSFTSETMSLPLLYPPCLPRYHYTTPRRAGFAIMLKWAQRGCALARLGVN